MCGHGLKGKVDATGCKTFEELEKCVINTMKHVPSNHVEELVCQHERESRVVPGCTMDEKTSIDRPL